MWRDPALALDILLAAEDAIAFTSSIDRTAFEASKLHQHAVIRCLEIMGEAANRTSPEFRATHPDIPWRLMTDMRPPDSRLRRSRPRHRLGRAPQPTATPDPDIARHRPTRPTATRPAEMCRYPMNPDASGGLVI
jgi:hypothetical protein